MSDIRVEFLPEYGDQPPPARVGIPTVVPVQNFDANKDADAVKAATVQAGGCTSPKRYEIHSTMIEILCKRSRHQRVDIREAYQLLHSGDITKDIQDKYYYSDNMIVALMKTPCVYMAQELKRTVKGMGTDERAPIEFLCGQSNSEMALIKDAYLKEIGVDMVKDIAFEFSGDAKKFVMCLMSGTRDEGPADFGKAAVDAQELIKRGTKQWGTDDNIFKRIFGSRSYRHLQAVFYHYKKLSGRHIISDINSELTGDLRTLLKSTVKLIVDSDAFFAEKIQKACEGWATDDRTFIRIIVSRSEIDMGNIGDMYNQMYGKTLGTFINGELTEESRRTPYRNAFLILSGGRQTLPRPIPADDSPRSSETP